MENNAAPHAPSADGARFWDGVKRCYMPEGALQISPDLKLDRAAASDVDPITYEVIRNSLVGANFDHGALLQQLCVSPVVIFARDFQTALLTEEADLVCMGPNLQYFANCSSLICKWILENRSANPGVGEGDIWFGNDPYVGSPHQNDGCIAAPVFTDGKLFGWVCNIVHYMEIGGPVMGPNDDASDIWQEASIYPPMRIGENRRVRDDVMQAFVRQSRMPLTTSTDLRAAIASAEAARTKLEGLIARYGAATVKAVMRGMLNAGEKLFRQRLATIPDGSWSHRFYTESAVGNDRALYKTQMTLTKVGDEIIVDNKGTDPQAGSINLTFGPYSGAVFSALTAQLTAELGGAFGGVYRNIRFDLEPGLLTSPVHPAAVSPTGTIQATMSIYCATLAVAKMVSCSTDPDVRALALGASIPHFYASSTLCWDAQGRMSHIAGADGMIGSLGGMPDRDGMEAGGHAWIPEAIAPNIEHYEMESPVLFLYRRYLATNADGAGRMQGGRGLELGVMAHGAGATVAPQMAMNDSFAKSQAPWGGNPGSRAFFKVKTGTNALAEIAEGRLPSSIDELSGEAAVIPFKGGKLPLMSAGDMYSWSSPTTAGWGDPLMRDPAAVLRDIAAGKHDAELAAEVYGVVLNGGGLDDYATDARRRALRAARIGREPQARPAGGNFPAHALRIGDRLVISDGEWHCDCGTALGRADANYKDFAHVTECPMTDLGPGHATDDPDMIAPLVYRTFDCPACGSRLDAEIARRDDPPLLDIAIMSGTAGFTDGGRIAARDAVDEMA
jgi:N-methylhydantoinase B